MHESTKRKLDYIPFIILVVTAIILVIRVTTGDWIFVWKNYVAFAMLGVSAFMFYKKHLFGVLATGITILAGLVGLLSLDTAIVTYTFGLGASSDGIPLLRFQPIFLLWMGIYFFICARHFWGITSKKYWDDVKANKK